MKSNKEIQSMDKKLNSKSSGTHISEVCNGKRKSAYGYIWKYFE